MSFDPSADFADVVDGLEAATLTYRGSGVTAALLHSHRNQIRERELEAAGGDAKLGDVIWQWPVSESSTWPELGSTLTDGDGDVWTILTLDKQVMRSKWSALCRNLAVEARLDTLITIQQATYTKGIGGALVATWADVYASVRARVQLITQRPEVEHDADETEETYRIILESDLSIDTIGADYRVIDSDGEVYAVTSYERSERIDTLPALEAVRTGTAGSSSSSSGV